jgi:hypothetical protein
VEATVDSLVAQQDLNSGLTYGAVPNAIAAAVAAVGVGGPGSQLTKAYASCPAPAVSSALEVVRYCRQYAALLFPQVGVVWGGGLVREGAAGEGASLREEGGGRGGAPGRCGRGTVGSHAVRQAH